jgi:NAD(P)-dependent dehydrogenase (short-subunit alcohol dehydrogenase family)
MADDRQTAGGQASDPRSDRGGLDDGVPAQQQRWPGHESGLHPRADHGEDSYRGAQRLAGRRALITGGDSGIGRAVALAFAREGADVAIAYFDEHDDAETTARLVREAGRRCELLPGDVRERAHCRSLVTRTVDALGGLDILVNNAAYQMEQTQIADITEAQLDRTFRTNIYAYIWLAQAALEHLDAGGVILNTGSITAMEGNASLMDYAATKGAIHAFTKSLAQAVADRGIRVNCVAPGPVWTPLIPATLSEDHVEAFGEDTLWERPAQPAEIAPTYVFLASDHGRYYSGEVFAPTGRAASS